MSRHWSTRGRALLQCCCTNTHPVCFPGFDLGELHDLFPEIKETGRSVAFHNEVQSIVDRNVARFKAERRHGPDTHALSRPAAAESVANVAVFELALDTGVGAHIVQSALSCGLVQSAAYRVLGARVSAETCVQYLVFTNDDGLAQGARLKQPPIRSVEECEALWERCEQAMSSLSHPITWFGRSRGKPTRICSQQAPGSQV